MSSLESKLEYIRDESVGRARASARALRMRWGHFHEDGPHEQPTVILVRNIDGRVERWVRTSKDSYELEGLE